MHPQLTVVVVTWDGWHLLSPCLTALRQQSLSPDLYRILVVDNGSTDGTVEGVHRDFPEVQILELPHNTGFAGGVAAALEVTDSPWVVLVNNDAVASPEFLHHLLDAAEQDATESVGAWTARILLADEVDGRRVVNSTGVVVSRDGNGRDRDWLCPADSPAPPAEVFGFCGGAALLRSSAVARCGGIDAGYFLYYEDTDLSWRLRMAGYGVRYVHAAEVTHKHGASSGIGSPQFRFYNERNRLTTLVKNAPVELILPVLVRHPLATALRCAHGPRGRREARVRAAAYLSFARRLPGTLGARWEISPQMKQRRRAVASLLDNQRTQSPLAIRLTLPKALRPTSRTPPSA